MAEEAFHPTPENRTAYRAALGCFATGVAVVTTTGAQGPIAMTANSFVSVSLDPPVVLWCPAKSSQRHDIFTQAPTFMVHVMASDQQGIASHFARTGHDFSITDWQKNEAGLPVLPGCLARFQCGLRAVHEGGDHSIVLGDVQQVWSRAGEGLIFKRGRYGGFAGLE